MKRTLSPSAKDFSTVGPISAAVALFQSGKQRVSTKAKLSYGVRK